MVRKVTLSGGVLDGKSFLVADDSDVLVHHAAHDGQYNLTDAYGEWVEYGVATVDISIDTSKLEAALEANPSLGRPAALPSPFLERVADMQRKLTAELLPNAPEPTGLARMVAKAADGYRVLLIAQRKKDAVAELRSLVDMAESWGDVKRIDRASGKERITFESGGMIAPVGLTGNLGSRGITADVLYLLDVSKDDPALSSVLPSLAASKRDAGIIEHGEA